MTTGSTHPRPRLTAVDALRGLVMVIMALDHVRDFFHTGGDVVPARRPDADDAGDFLHPLDHARLRPFVLSPRRRRRLAAIARDGSKARLSRFLWTRGLWLILVELIVMRLAMNFTLSPQYPVILLILWALGLAMIALAALIHLPLRVLAGLSVAIIVLHNTLDGIQAAQLGAFEGLWRILHQPGFFMPAGIPVVVATRCCRGSG